MSKRKADREARKVARDYSLAIGGSIVIALLIRFFLLEAYRMPSRAMRPALEPGDTLFVSKLSYGFRLPWVDTRLNPITPKYGDVVVFEFPEEPGREYIKRIIGLPGDRVQLTKNTLLLNGNAVTLTPTGGDLCAKETLPNKKSYDVCFEPPVLIMEKEMTIPEGNVYLAGDLRSTPFEGRRLKSSGIAPIAMIRGRAFFIWISPKSIGNLGTVTDMFSKI